jgi:hypothetical protein
MGGSSLVVSLGKEIIMPNLTMRPAKELTVPQGATHWRSSYSNPFYKKDESGNWHVFSDVDGWSTLNNSMFGKKHLGVAIAEPIEIQPPFDTSNCEVVQTVLGEGYLLGQDLFGDYLVELKVNPKGFTPLRFSKKDIIDNESYNKPSAKSMFAELKEKTDHENGLFEYSLGLKFEDQGGDYRKDGRAVWYSQIQSFEDGDNLHLWVVFDHEENVAEIELQTESGYQSGNAGFVQTLSMQQYYMLTSDNSIECLNALWTEAKSKLSKTDDPDYLPERFLNFSEGTSILDVYEYLQSFNAEFKDESIGG